MVKQTISVFILMGKIFTLGTVAKQHIIQTEIVQIIVIFGNGLFNELIYIKLSICY